MNRSQNQLFSPFRLALCFSLAVLSLVGGILVFDQPDMQVAMAQTAGQDRPPDRAPTNVGLPLPGTSSSSSSQSISQSSQSQISTNNSSASTPQTSSPNISNNPLPVTTAGGTTQTPQIDPTQVATTTPRSGGLEVAVILITVSVFGGVYYLYKLKDKKDKLETAEKKLY